jgi:hypothetical protein
MKFSAQLCSPARPTIEFAIRWKEAILTEHHVASGERIVARLIAPTPAASLAPRQCRYATAVALNKIQHGQTDYEQQPQDAGDEPDLKGVLR